MKEVKIQIDILETKMQDMQLEVQKLVDFGNVPTENWAKVEDLVIKINSCDYAISLFKETLAAIIHNAK